ncbi:protein TolR [Moraxella sp. ZJ142]|uniref:protein TolR n=1 Tax=Moraxella marmotae TaxID=3344520 RepID=UPI0035D4BC63
MATSSKFARRQKPLNSQMNVVPYIDVMLVLLVIFMIAAPMLSTGVSVSLPKEDTQAVTQTDDLPIIISVQADGKLFVSHKDAIDEPMNDDSLDALLRQMHSQNPKLQVMVNADAANPYQQIMHIMALIQNAGITQVSLLSESNK